MALFKVPAHTAFAKKAVHDAEIAVRHNPERVVEIAADLAKKLSRKWIEVPAATMTKCAKVAVMKACPGAKVSSRTVWNNQVFENVLNVNGTAEYKAVARALGLMLGGDRKRVGRNFSVMSVDGVAVHFCQPKIEGAL